MTRPDDAVEEGSPYWGHVYHSDHLGLVTEGEERL